VSNKLSKLKLKRIAVGLYIILAEQHQDIKPKLTVQRKLT